MGKGKLWEQPFLIKRIFKVKSVGKPPTNTAYAFANHTRLALAKPRLSL